MIYAPDLSHRSQSVEIRWRGFSVRKHGEGEGREHRRSCIVEFDGVGDEGVMAFTAFGIESLIDLVKMHKDDTSLLRRTSDES